MSQFSLPLDSAALDRLEDKDLDRVRESAYQDLIEQGRAALVLRDELASRSRVSAQHATHHDDCGCLTARYEARIATLEAALLARHGGEPLALLDELTEARSKVATLEAELAASREDARAGWTEQAEMSLECYALLATANDLRAALEKLACLGNGDRPGNSEGNVIAQRALAANAVPAASLAAHDAEVGLRVVSECAMTMRSRCSCSHCDENAPGWKGRDIVERALAAQAATHTEERWECPTCGLGVSADEDGCCSTCGADCTTKPATVTIQAQEVKP